MKLSAFLPNFREVLFKEVREKKTAGGIIIPEADFKVKTFSDPVFDFDHEKEHSVERAGDYVVIATGPDCITTRPGDKIMIKSAFKSMINSLEFEDETVLIISEQQIAGGTKEGR